MTTEFTFRILGCQTWDVHDDNVDVEIALAGGERFAATFFTLQNIRSLMDRYRLTGDCSHGEYMWSSNMIIVDNLEPETISRAIAGLLQEGELRSACCPLK
jgi:hypothetical protein